MGIKDLATFAKLCCHLFKPTATQLLAANLSKLLNTLKIIKPFPFQAPNHRAQWPLGLKMMETEKQMKTSLLLLALTLTTVACNKSDDYYAKDKLLESANPIGNEGDGGSTAGGSTGGSSSGSTAGAEGGAAGGSTGSNKTYTDVSVTENFVQKSSDEQIDILWVVDNSGSMSDEQDNLAENFAIFAQKMAEASVDFKMAITTTDGTTGKSGVAVAGSIEKLTSAKAQANAAQFVADFKSLIKVGTNGSGKEMGLHTAKDFFSVNSSFLRANAKLAIIEVSDEEEQGASTVKDYVDAIAAKKTNAGSLKIYSICDLNSSSTGSGVLPGCARYKAASDQTGSVSSDIHQDFHTVLEDLGDSIVNLLNSFVLAAAPKAGSAIKVYVNNVLKSEGIDYTYDAASRTIKFKDNKLPPVGAAIKVEYVKQV